MSNSEFDVITRRFLESCLELRSWQHYKHGVWKSDAVDAVLFYPYSLSEKKLITEFLVRARMVSPLEVVLKEDL